MHSDFVKSGVMASEYALVLIGLHQVKFEHFHISIFVHFKRFVQICKNECRLGITHAFCIAAIFSYYMFRLRLSAWFNLLRCAKITSHRIRHLLSILEAPFARWRAVEVSALHVESYLRGFYLFSLPQNANLVFVFYEIQSLLSRYCIIFHGRECGLFCVFFLTLRQIHDICLWLFKTLRIRGSSEKFTSSTQSSIWIWIISLWAISPFALFRARNIADRKFYTFIAQVILVGDAVIRACMHQLQV